MISRLPLNLTWQCANKYTLIDLYKIEMVNILHHVVFIQSNSDQKYFMDNNMRTNRDIVVNTVLKQPEIIPWIGPHII